MVLKMYREASFSEEMAIIGIAAGKGGVGKSSIAVNLAFALSHRGYRVGLLDADLYGPSLCKMLPEGSIPQQKGEMFLPAVCAGIKMISMAHFHRDDQAAIVRAPLANRIIAQFLKQVEWGTLDYLLIDFPPGTGDIQLTLAQTAHLTAALMVTTPQEVALLDVRKAIAMFQEVNVPLLGIVENMSFYYHPSTKEKVFIFGRGGGEKLAKESGIPFLGAIPLDPLLCHCGDRGHSFLASDPLAASATSQAILAVAESVVDHVALLKEHTGRCLTSFELVWREMS